MKALILFAIVLPLASLSSCRSTHARDTDLPSAGQGGEREVEAWLALTDTRMERKAGSVALDLTISNRSDRKLEAEVAVQCFDRAGAPIAGGISQWTAISLGAGAKRALRIEGLPASTESWTLMARRR